ncbi:hypothetical protein MERGE_000893 [Pneumocystis wakefieldiae]|uniref:RAVE complex protein Rav1 C-terminal domain-containing protein n=1 Tax=Pneumocystis wakefieldiae TaxID=38082 RepID=A0A899G141_9ASCO|nr:hypothetical protein MERGE_000893 [Pneumocystis wakefieldiae]
MHKFTADLNLLYEIVLVADTSKQKGSFLAIFEAYDTVLKRKNIDSTNDRVYYKFLLKLVQIQGEGWEYRFKSLIKNMGIDFRSIKKITPENSFLDYKNRNTDHTFTPNSEESSKSLKDFFYSSDETSISSLTSQITRSSPATTRSLQKENIKISTYNNNIIKDIKHAEYIYNERCILIKQKYFKVWVKKTEDIFNYFQSMYSKAILHDSYILSFQALGIWRQKSLYLKKTRKNAENAGNYTENIQLASNFFNYTLLRLTFMNWRQVLHLNILLIKLENKLRRKIIYKWILKERLILLLRVRGRRLYYLTFYLWKKYYRALDDKNILNIINSWRKKNINIQENNITAKYRNNYFYKRHSIVHWKEKFHKRIKAREQHVNSFIYNHYHKLCHRAIMHWQYCFKNIILNYDIALKFRANKYQCLLIEFFSIWTNKYKNLNIMLIQTGKDKNLKNIKLYFIKWKIKQNTMLSMNNNALVILIRKNHALMKKTLVAYASGTSVPIFINGKKIIQILSIEKEITAVAINKESGKICVSSKSNIYIFDIAKEMGISWNLKLTFTINNETISTLSWGDKDEILIGGTCLNLYSSNIKNGAIIWSQKLSRPVIFAIISPDAKLIASISQKVDCFIKIWKKPLLHEPVESLKFIYLPHPEPVTSIKWKKKSHNDRTINNILYSMSKDKILRIWTQENLPESYIFKLSYIVDVRNNASFFEIPSNNLGEDSSCLIIDNNILTSSLRHIPKNSSNEEINKLIDIKNKSADICLAFDNNGQIWAFAILAHNNGINSEIEIVPIFSTKKSNLHISKSLKHAEYFAIPACEQENIKVNIDLYFIYFGENIDVYQINFLDFISSTPQKCEFNLQTIWTGHVNHISSLVKSLKNNILLSKTVDGTVIIWKIKYFNKSEILKKLINLQLKDSPTHIIIFNEKKSIILNFKNISILEIGKKCANIIAKCEDVPVDIILCFMQLKNPLNLPQNLLNETYFLAITETKKVWIWKLSKIRKKENTENIKMEKIQEFSLFYNSDLHLVSPINQIKQSSYFQKEIFITISAIGQLKIWSKKISDDGKLYIFPEVESLETKILKPKIIKEFSKKLAIICQKGKELTIWDIRSLEFSEIEECRYFFPTESEISNLDWTCTKNSQLILALSFKYKVILICQTSKNYENKQKSWFLFRSFDISNLTNSSILHLIFLNNMTLIIGNKNQLFLYNKANDNIDTIDIPHETNEKYIPTKNIMFLNAILPVYHPQFLEQLLLIGDIENVRTILTNLYKILDSFEKNYAINENKIEIKDSFLGIPIDVFFKKKKNQHNKKQPYYQLFTVEDENIETIDQIPFEILLSRINDCLLSYTITNLNTSEQHHLISLIKSIKNIEFHKNSIDTNGIRYYLFFLKNLYLFNYKKVNISMKEALWAFHSDSQETLLRLINQEYEKNFTFIQIHSSYCFFWLKDRENLKLQMETLAYKKYVINDKNPEFCSLFYIALRKKNILLRLWEMATGHSNQKIMINFLSNDFSEARWKLAAQKNAFVLLGKHRYEYSAAFFLLADKLQNAVNICVKNLQDISLAIAISRVYEGDNSQTFKNLLRTYIIPDAIKFNDRWLACWAFWILGKIDLSIKSLVLPLTSLVEKNSKNIIPIDSKETLDGDPSLIILYKELKSKSSQIFKNPVISQL